MLGDYSMFVKTTLHSLKCKEFIVPEPVIKPFAHHSNQIEMNRWNGRTLEQGRLSDLPENERRQALLKRFHESRSPTSR